MGVRVTDQAVCYVAPSMCCHIEVLHGGLGRADWDGLLPPPPSTVLRNLSESPSGSAY